MTRLLEQSGGVTLIPVDSPALVALVAGWLTQKENSQWLDFGDGQQDLTADRLQIMTQHQAHLLRAFAVRGGGPPVGVVGLSEINPQFKTARIWVVVGDKSFRARGYGTQAVSAMLTLAFRDLQLHAVNAWIVEGHPARRIAERLKFQLIGRRRQCHEIDGQPRDRLWFDILAPEHRGGSDA